MILRTTREGVLLLSLLGALFVGCTGVDLSTPVATFDTIREAIAAEDIGAYKACFTTKALESEAMLKDFERDPDAFWDELQGIFRSPITVQQTDNDGSTARLSVTAPEAEGGGIGGMTLEKVGEEWKIRAW